MDEEEWLLWLCLCPELSPKQRQALLRQHGSPSQAAAVWKRRRPPEPDRQQLLQALKSPRLSRGHPCYPRALFDLDEDAPDILYYQGNPELLLEPRRRVTIIGTRKPTGSGRLQARRFGAILSSSGIQVVSGLARGIDASAHWGSLEAKTPEPIGVAACGLDLNYPAENRHLFNRLAQQGCVLSEYPPGTPAWPQNFSRRNRLLAALAEQILVIECPASSGVMLTVDHALQLGREVFVLPGPLGAFNYLGNLQLLQQGANLACNPQDLLSAGGPRGGPTQPLLDPQSAGGPRGGRTQPPLDPQSAGGAFSEEWSQRLGLSLSETLRQLSRWERDGLIYRDPQGSYAWCSVISEAARA